MKNKQLDYKKQNILLQASGRLESLEDCTDP